jgi:hypothetical protein
MSLTIGPRRDDADESGNLLEKAAIRLKAERNINC